MANFALVKRGARDIEGTNVRKIQLLLRARGAALGVDGIFGPQTENAVKQFQGAKGLVVDGVVGNQTWSALIIQVQRGSTGDAVLAVQTQLPGADDAIFGPQTEGAVRAFQTRAGLVSDGIVGPLTWSALTFSPIQPAGTSG
jgi:peptidoglycan hydrolase-like protein with peptidoglycan-binding domain